MESIKELRKICQETRDDVLYQRNWFDRHVTRRISIHITRVFLRLGISANQATLVDLLIGLGAGALFTLASPAAWFGGIALFYLYFVFDCVDGEIARYRRTSSPTGSYLDGGLGVLMWPYVLACMTFGINATLGSTLVFAFGFLAALGWLLYTASALFPYPILHALGRLPEVVDTAGPIKEPWPMALGRAVFGTRGFIPAMLLVTAVDAAVGTFAVGTVALNARFVYLAVFALATLAGITLRTRGVMKHGVRLEKP